MDEPSIETLPPLGRRAIWWGVGFFGASVTHALFRARHDFDWPRFLTALGEDLVLSVILLPFALYLFSIVPDQLRDRLHRQ